MIYTRHAWLQAVQKNQAHTGITEMAAVEKFNLEMMPISAALDVIHRKLFSIGISLVRGMDIHMNQLQNKELLMHSVCWLRRWGRLSLCLRLLLRLGRICIGLGVEFL